MSRLKLWLRQLFCRHMWAKAEKKNVALRYWDDGEVQYCKMGTVTMKKCMKCDCEKAYFKRNGSQWQRRFPVDEAKILVSRTFLPT